MSLLLQQFPVKQDASMLPPARRELWEAARQAFPLVRRRATLVLVALVLVGCASTPERYVSEDPEARACAGRGGIWEVTWAYPYSYKFPLHVAVTSVCRDYTRVACEKDGGRWQPTHIIDRYGVPVPPFAVCVCGMVPCPRWPGLIP